MLRVVLPLTAFAAAFVAWHLAITTHPGTLVPSPIAALRGIVELAEKGLLFRYVVASLFRVTWGYLAALVLAIPLGVLLGMWHRGERALHPILQVLRPISPLAWIPIAILWFGVGDRCRVPDLPRVVPADDADGHSRGAQLDNPPRKRARREHAADFVGRFYFRQDPRLLKWALTNPLDRVQYQPLTPLRKDFELIVRLMRETGVLDRDIAFEEYIDVRFAENAQQQTEWRYEPGDATAE